MVDLECACLPPYLPASLQQQKAPYRVSFSYKFLPRPYLPSRLESYVFCYSVLFLPFSRFYLALSCFLASSWSVCRSMVV